MNVLFPAVLFLFASVQLAWASPEPILIFERHAGCFVGKDSYVVVTPRVITHVDGKSSDSTAPVAALCPEGTARRIIDLYDLRLTPDELELLRPALCMFGPSWYTISVTVDGSKNWTLNYCLTNAETLMALLESRGTKTTHEQVEAVVLRLHSIHQAATKLATTTEQAGAGQPATRPESKSEGSDKPQPESDGRSR